MTKSINITAEQLSNVSFSQQSETTDNKMHDSINEVMK